MFCLFISLVSCSGTSSGQVSLRFARWAGVEESRRFQVLIDQFQKENPDISVSTEYLPWDAYNEKMLLALETGDAPDVFMVSSSLSDAYVQGSLLEALDTYDQGKLLDQFAPGARSPMIKGGHLYGVPIGLGVPVLFYNRSMLLKEGVHLPSPTEPMTWDEFYDILPRLKKTDAKGEVIQYPLRMSSSDLAENLLNTYASPVFSDPVRQNVLGIKIYRAQAAMARLAQTYRDGLQPPLEWGDDARAFGTPDNGLKNGNVAFIYTGMWSLPIIKEAGIDYASMPLPRGERRAPRAFINYMNIPVSSRHKEAAWTLVRWFATKGQETIALSGDYPANLNYNPSDIKGDIPKEVYQTVATEKASMVANLNIRDKNIRLLYNTWTYNVSRFLASPQEATRAFFQAARKIAPDSGE